jgi:hypothetical protein
MKISVIYKVVLLLTPKQIFMAKYSKGAGKKVERAMHEMHEGKLKSGRSGKKVKSRQQAIAIGLSEARKEGAKVPKKGAAKKGGAKKGAKKGGAKKGGAKKSAPKKGGVKKGATKKAASKKGAKKGGRKSGGRSKGGAKKGSRKRS